MEFFLQSILTSADSPHSDVDDALAVAHDRIPPFWLTLFESVDLIEPIEQADGFVVVAVAALSSARHRSTNLLRATPEFGLAGFNHIVDQWLGWLDELSGGTIAMVTAPGLRLKSLRAELDKLERGGSNRLAALLDGTGQGVDPGGALCGHSRFRPVPWTEETELPTVEARPAASPIIGFRREARAHSRNDPLGLEEPKRSYPRHRPTWPPSTGPQALPTFGVDLADERALPPRGDPSSIMLKWLLGPFVALFVWCAVVAFPPDVVPDGWEYIVLWSAAVVAAAVRSRWPLSTWAVIAGSFVLGRVTGWGVMPAWALFPLATATVIYRTRWPVALLVALAAYPTMVACIVGSPGNELLEHALISTSVMLGLPAVVALVARAVVWARRSEPAAA